MENDKKFSFKKPENNQECPSKEEQKQEMIKDMAEKRLAALELARRCLHSPDFKSLRKGYELAEQATVNRLLDYANEEGDPIKFAYGVKDLLGKIEGIRSLINAVVNKAHEKEKENEQKQP